MSPFGSDARACSRSAPCGSFARAYRVARPGQVVEVRGGRYPAQSITRDPSKTARADVLFRPAEGARVVLDGSLSISGSHLEVRGLRAKDWDVLEGASDVTLRNLDVDIFWVTSATDVRVIGGDVGPTDNDSAQIRSGYLSPHFSRNILLDGVRFHDFRRTEDGVHMECIHIWGVQNLTIRHSRFQRCAIFDVFIDNDGQAGDVQGVRIENNFFDRATSRGYYSLFFDPKGHTMRDLLIRNNSFLQTAFIDVENGSVGNVRFVGNVGPRAAHHCYAGVTFAYNVWDAARCGATDRRAPLGFRNAARFDLRLKPCAAAVDHGSPRDFPRTDIEGQRRPRGNAPDAGADEVTSTRCRR